MAGSKRSVVWAVLMSIAAVMLWSAQVSSAAAKESVDWLNGRITVTGLGIAPPNAVNYTHAKAMAERAAVLDGYRQLAETINGVNVDAESTVEQMILTSDVIKTNVSALIKGARVENTRALPDGSCEVTMSISMYGASDSLAGAVLPRHSVKEPFPLPTPINPSVGYASPGNVNVNVQVDVNAGSARDGYTTRAATYSFDNYRFIYPIAPTPPTAPRLPAPPSEVRAPEAAVPAVNQTVNNSEGPYTGLVVDCTGLGLKPAMSPVIMNNVGVSIYGSKNLDYDLVTKKGMAAYSGSPDVSKIARAGDNPLRVKAMALERHNINPVLSVEDANRVLVENEKSHFLDDLNVVFVR